jgi:anti-sigma B factor antagonist
MATTRQGGPSRPLPLLFVDLEHRHGCDVVRPIGEIDRHTVAVLRDHLAAVIRTRRLVLDLCDVAFIDSAGLGAVASAIRTVRDNDGDVVVARPRAAVDRVLHTIGLDRFVAVTPSLDEAFELLTLTDRPAG